MKTIKYTILLFAISLFSINSFAQLPDGSIAPDFTLVDENGTTHNLYSLLNEGKTVFLDLFAVWCPPCWTYKQSGALEDLYIQHGPSSYPGVNANSTNDVMVFAIEADGNDCSCLTGGVCNTSTQGDWLTGTSHPTICMSSPSNSSSNLSSDYQTGFFWPYVYMICPDKTTTLIGQAANPYSFVGNCNTSTSVSEAENVFSIIPNPSNDVISIILKNSDNEKIEVVDVSGKLIYSEVLSTIKTKLDVSDFVKGVYFIKTNNQITKFIKNEKNEKNIIICNGVDCNKQFNSTNSKPFINSCNINWAYL